MSRVVVDASVAIKWFVPEVHYLDAGRLLSGPYDLVGPDLIRQEFGNILWKKWRQGDLTTDETRAIMRDFEAMPLEIRSTGRLMRRALLLAQETGRSVYDTTYLMLALTLNCPLVTADRRFHNAILASPYGGHMLWVEDVP